MTLSALSALEISARAAKKSPVLEHRWQEEAGKR
jgi:hypothetical protein